jgi:ubiquinone/menaquinone biosynthesis C-methylase UbiE
MDATRDAERIAATYCDLEQDSRWRFDILGRHLPQARRILDLAAGYGTAVFHGCRAGLDVFGIEPDAQKIAIAQDLLADAGMPAAWKTRLLRAVGENLPFPDDSFDAVTSYQTLEHVRNAKAVLGECIRIIRPGGGIHIHCPDYSGTFEGHYQLPWLPYFPHGMAKVYLRLLGRPISGWQGITPITHGRVLAALKQLKRENPRLDIRVISLRREQFSSRFRERFPAFSIPVVTGMAYPLYRLSRCLQTLFREEKALHIWISVLRKR